jgi:hypothetical protein
LHNGKVSKVSLSSNCLPEQTLGSGGASGPAGENSGRILPLL